MKKFAMACCLLSLQLLIFTQGRADDRTDYFVLTPKWAKELQQAGYVGFLNPLNKAVGGDLLQLSSSGTLKGWKNSSSKRAL